MNENDNLIRIILVDDDKEDCLIFEEAIKGLNMRTNLSFFHDGIQVLDYLNKPDSVLPDILFLDINMPLMSGIECLKELRANQRFSNLPIAIYSTSSSESDIEETFVSGANVYINKPSSFDKLQKVLKDILKMQYQFHNSNLNISTFLYSC